MVKIGRNEPCPCGSGKKYKKCCLITKALPPEALQYRRLSDAYNRLLDRLQDHAERVFGKESILSALTDFLPLPDDEEMEINEKTIERIFPLFLPWFLFNWEYVALGADIELPGPEGRTVAEHYAETRGEKLNSLERSLIDRINRVPYSFWEILSVDKGRGMTLQDVLTGSRMAVQERSGSESVEPGDLIFGRAVVVDGVGMLSGIGPAIISARYKIDLINLRKQLQKDEGTITRETVEDWEFELIEFYYEIEQALFSPPMPQMQNTDGERMEFHKLIYEITSPDSAFHKLCDLCATATAEELWADAERDETGRIVSGEIPWSRPGHKGTPAMSNTLLGHIVIDGGRLTAEVNSARRAKRLRREIESRLGDEGRFKVDEIQSPEAMMRNRDPDDPGAAQRRSEKDALMQNPEIQEHLAEMMRQHWEAWVDMKIAALGGKTPTEAVRTADGRESVEALLRHIERGKGQDPFTLEANRKGAQRARERLGLTAR